MEEVFVADAPARRAAGISGDRVFAVLGRPQAITIALEIADADKAIGYLASAFQVAMRRAGGLGQPAFSWTAEVDRPTCGRRRPRSWMRTTALPREPRTRRRRYRARLSKRRRTQSRPASVTALSS